MKKNLVKNIHMKKTLIQHAGRTISFREMTSKTNFVRHCVLCNEKILPGQQIFGVYCHGPYPPFPNSTIHKDCICPPPAPFDNNDPFAWGAAKLHELWNKAQEFRHWFTDGE